MWESLYNKLRLVQGQCNPGLSEEGVKQAERLGRRLSENRFDLVYTSDLKRAIQTIEILLSSNRKTEVSAIQDSRTKEVNLGIWQGWPIYMFQSCIADAGSTFESFNPEGGESFDQMRSRAVEFLEEMCMKIAAPEGRDGSSHNLSPPSNDNPYQVLLVIHGLVIRQLIKHFQKIYGTKLPSNKLQGRSPQNTSVSQFEIELQDGRIINVTCNLHEDDTHLRQE